MAEDVSIEFVGATSIGPDLSRLGARLERDGTAALRRAAQSLVGTVRSRMPVLTGALVRSVAVTSDESGVVDVGAGNATVVYAGWIEFGGSRGRPFLPGGRYLLPVVTASDAQVGRAVSQQATATIGGFGWSHTS